MPQSHERFATTRWSMIAAARDDSSPHARRALSELCQSYWPPLYAFARSRGYQRADAQDLTQAFFADLLEERFFSKADETRGRFRTYLLTAFTRFSTSEWRRKNAQKRGGGARVLQLDFERIEAVTVPDGETPEAVFQRRWALTLLERVVRLLQEEYIAKGKLELFELLRGQLSPGGDLESYDVVAKKLNMTEGAIKVAAHRMRQRYRDILRAEIAETVTSEAEIDEEIQELMKSFQKSR